MIGREIIFKKIAGWGKQIIGITFFQSIGTFLFVSLVFAVAFLIADIPVYVAFIFGGIALATAPAPALSIVNEYRTKGPVTDTLIPLAAIGRRNRRRRILYRYLRDQRDQGQSVRVRFVPFVGMVIRPSRRHRNRRLNRLTPPQTQRRARLFRRADRRIMSFHSGRIADGLLSLSFVQPQLSSDRYVVQRDGGQSSQRRKIRKNTPSLQAAFKSLADHCDRQSRFAAELPSDRGRGSIYARLYPVEGGRKNRRRLCGR